VRAKRASVLASRNARSTTCSPPKPRSDPLMTGPIHLGPAPGGIDTMGIDEPLPPDADPLLARLAAGGADGIQTIEGDDGSVTLELPEDDTAAQLAALDHDANLAEFLDDSTLERISLDLLEAYDADKASRSEWEQAYADGLKLLGLKIEKMTEPWPDACGITHPILTDACIRFQARTITELFPADGPVKTKIVGRITPEKQAQAERVRNFMNYHLTEVDREYFADTDQMLFMLAFSGQTFKKVMYDPVRGHAISRYLRGESVVHSYYSDIRSCGRVTHVDPISRNEMRRRQITGLYRRTPLVEPTQAGTDSPIKEATDSISGREASLYEHDDQYTVLEMHVEYEVPGFEHREPIIGPDGAPVLGPDGQPLLGEPTGLAQPYIITIDQDSRKVLAIRRNWREGGNPFTPLSYFVGYGYVPGPGSYALGLIHIIGGLTQGATSILRQLVDAGELANLPAGWKAKGLKVADNDQPLAPGEWRDVDAPGMDLDKALKILPYKGADATLHQLLMYVVELAERLAGVQEMTLGDLPQNAPVGSVLAAIEQAAKPLSAVHKRLHEAQKQEFKLIAECIASYIPEAGYPYEVEGDARQIAAADFGPAVDVIPVSDPNIATKQQRVMMSEATWAVGKESAEVGVQVEFRELALDRLRALGVSSPERFLPEPQQPQPTDPLSENAAFVAGAPVAPPQPGQAHEAHLEVHLDMLSVPGLAQTPAAGALVGHFISTLATWARDQAGAKVMQMTNGQVQLPPPGQPLPPEFQQYMPQVDAEIAMIAAALSRQWMPRLADVLKAVGGGGPDALMQVEMAKIDQKERADQRKHELEAMKVKINAELDSIKLAEDARQAELNAELQREGIRSKEGQNAEDNATALIIAGAKQAAGNAPPAIDPNPNPGAAAAPRRI
jgi:hypothetical protein